MPLWIRPFAIVVALGSVLLSGCTAGAVQSGAPSSTPVPQAPSARGDVTFDRAFIDMMVPHHQSAVEMAKIALQRAAHPEVKKLADEIISAQQGEIGQMRQWREAWFGSTETPPMSEMPLLPGMSMPTMPGGSHGMGSMPASPASSTPAPMAMDMTVDIAALKTADPFDRAFIDAMTAHHSMAIEAATLLLAYGRHAELTAMARSIIESQQREIDQMKSWRRAWYPGG